MKEIYLGDGLYASFDGYMFILRAPREDGDHWVALEPRELQAFMNFVTVEANKKAAKHEQRRDPEKNPSRDG